MTERIMDAEQLALLLENRLDPRERAALLARLGASEADFEVFAEAAATLAETRAEDQARYGDETGEGESASGDPPGTGTAPPAGVVPLRSARAWRRPAARLALAAGLAGAAFVSWALLRERGAAPVHAGEAVALLSTPAAGLPAGWPARPWDARATRGNDLTPEARAARIGARLVDLELSARAGDSVATAGVVAELEWLLSGVPAGEAVSERVRRVEAGAGRGGDAVLPPLREAQRAARVAGEERVVLGAWAEAARLAAARRDAAFFRAGGTRRLLARATEVSGLPSEALGALERIRAALSGDGAPEWETLRRESTDLLTVLAT